MWPKYNLSFSGEHAAKVRKLSLNMATYVKVRPALHPEDDASLIDGDNLIIAYKLCKLPYDWIDPTKTYKIFTNEDKTKSLAMEWE